MAYLGNIAEDATLDFKFSTAAGAPATLSGSPSLAVYKANGTTQSTAGITLTADFDSVTGLNHVRIDTSADAFYATGNDYSVVIAAGTVGGVSVVGYVVGEFSIQNRYHPALLGSGASTVTLTITEDDNVTPIADADVWVTSTASIDSVVAGTSQTDSNGQVAFLLDDGATYFLWCQKDGITSIQGESFVASAD